MADDPVTEFRNERELGHVILRSTDSLDEVGDLFPIERPPHYLMNRCVVARRLSPYHDRRLLIWTRHQSVRGRLPLQIAPLRGSPRWAIATAGSPQPPR
jgi:hypothetical protein